MIIVGLSNLHLDHEIHCLMLYRVECILLTQEKQWYTSEDNSNHHAGST
jgi:hypothetical protein